jgi:chromosome segregation ATPase
MNRALIAFNFLGVITLAVLCAMQWQVNSVLHARADAFERTTVQQKADLEKDQQTITAYTADLEDFRQRLSLSEKQLKELDDKLATEIQERNQLAAERDDLRVALGKWKAALDDRDKTINKAREELASLQNDRNDAVKKLNDLTDKWNALVKQWNQEQARR